MVDDPTIAALRAAVERASDDAELRKLLGWQLLLAGEADEAIEHAQAAVDLAPNDETARELLEAAKGETPTTAPAAAPLDDVPFEHDRPVMTLDDVAGLESVKRRIDTEFLAPSRDPELAERYGKRASGGLLLYGPPGCGKTYLARALAGELSAGFIPIDSAMVVSAHPGESAQNIKAIFDYARRNTPVLLFFDEVEAIAHQRDSLGANWLKGMVNQFLAELDGFSSNDGIYVVGATNAPWDVDSAMRRPGRFDRVVVVLPPDEPARAAILDIHLRDRPVGKVDIARLAGRTEGFSGADLAYVVEEASSTAYEQAMETGEDVLIDTAMLESAARGISPSVGAWMEQAKNYVMFSNKDGSLDELAAYMRAKRLL
ncbi:MAG: AAA family ATPase [Acidimicrobiia bacterium]|nr:MAG: AAA family ATPase [Acidimicrobiia bacterium]